MLESEVERLNNYILSNVTQILGNTTTYQSDLEKLGQRIFNNKFIGVYPSDRIPKMKSNTYAIINLDSSDGPGSHWVSIMKRINDVLLYDSFGRPSSEILQSLAKSGNGKVINAGVGDAEQDDEETNCGARSIAALILYDLYGYKVLKYLKML